MRQTNSEKLAYGFSQFKNEKKKKTQKMFKFEEKESYYTYLTNVCQCIYYI